MGKKILSYDQGRLIDRLYQGAEHAVDDTNVINVDFLPADRMQSLIDDISAILDDPSNLSIAEPVLREALQYIAAQILIRS